MEQPRKEIKNINFVYDNVTRKLVNKFSLPEDCRVERITYDKAKDEMTVCVTAVKKSICKHCGTDKKSETKCSTCGY